MDRLINEALEKRIIGELLNSTNAYYMTSHTLKADMFYNAKCEKIYTAISQCAERGRYDLLSVQAQLSATKGCDTITLEDLLECSSSCATDLHVREHVLQLGDLAMRRRLFAKAQEVALAACDPIEPIDATCDDFLRFVQDEQASQQVEIETAYNASDELRGIIEKNAQGVTNGIPTGWGFFDAYGGFQLDWLVTIAAESGVGKTAFAVQMAKEMAKKGVPVAYYSLEMRKGELMTRIVASETSIERRVIATKPLTNEQQGRVICALNYLEQLPIYFDDRNKTYLETIKGSIRRMVREKGVQVAFVDHIQRISGHGKMSEYDLVSDISKQLKDLALELHIVIVELCQLNRDTENKRPETRLRGSGRILEESDLLICLERHKDGQAYSGKFANYDTRTTAILQIPKARGGGEGEFIVNCIPEYCLFKPYDPKYSPAQPNEHCWQKPF